MTKWTQKNNVFRIGIIDMKTVLVILIILLIIAGMILVISATRFTVPGEVVAETDQAIETYKATDLQDTVTSIETSEISVSPQTPEVSGVSETTDRCAPGAKIV